MKRGGFSLFEVFLALAILAGSIIVIGAVNQLALRNAATARDLTTAMELCDTKFAEIRSGITTPDATDSQPFDSSSYPIDPDGPGWLYSISQNSAGLEGLIAVTVTVSRDLPAERHPVSFSMVQMMQDPNYTASTDSSSSSTSTTTPTN